RTITRTGIGRTTVAVATRASAFGTILARATITMRAITTVTFATGTTIARLARQGGATLGRASAGLAAVRGVLAIRFARQSTRCLHDGERTAGQLFDITKILALIGCAERNRDTTGTG